MILLRPVFARLLRIDPAPFGLVSAGVALGWCVITLIQPGVFGAYRSYTLLAGGGQGVWAAVMGALGTAQFLVVVFGTIRQRRVSATVSCFVWTAIATLIAMAQWPDLNTAVSTYAVIALTQLWSLVPLAHADR